jgi:hypothetical protein
MPDDGYEIADSARLFQSCAAKIFARPQLGIDPRTVIARFTLLRTLFLQDLKSQFTEVAYPRRADAAAR